MAPSWQPARTRKSFAVQYGGVADDLWWSRAHAASLSLPSIFGRNMAHSEAGSRLESNIVPVAGVNDLPQLRQRYACTPLRSWPSRLKSAEPHHGHASGTYELKNSASPPLASGGWRSRRTFSCTVAASLEAAASWLSLHVMW